MVYSEIRLAPPSKAGYTDMCHHAQFYAVLRIRPRVSDVLGKYSTSWDASLALDVY